MGKFSIFISYVYNIFIFEIILRTSLYFVTSIQFCNNYFIVAFFDTKISSFPFEITTNEERKTGCALQEICCTPNIAPKKPSFNFRLLDWGKQLSMKDGSLFHIVCISWCDWRRSLEYKNRSSQLAGSSHNQVRFEHTFIFKG